MQTAPWQDLIGSAVFGLTLLMLAIGECRRPARAWSWPLYGWDHSGLLWLLLAGCALLAAVRVGSFVWT